MQGRRLNLLLLVVLAVAGATAETIRYGGKRAGAGPFFQILRDGEWDFMDRTGRVVIAPAFAGERDFFHALAAVALPEGNWGFIDESGKLASPLVSTKLGTSLTS